MRYNLFYYNWSSDSDDRIIQNYFQNTSYFVETSVWHKLPFHNSNTTSDEAQNLQELSKAELLEALCHSQTRAREAEKAAQAAYNEKEHVITHFLKQASQLFAYKQWFHILQLETTCLHLKNSKYQLVYTRFPDFVPWVPTKDTKRVRRKAAKTKPGLPRYKIGKSFGSFVLGLTFAGAGLLLGWTLGWLFRWFVSWLNMFLFVNHLVSS